MIAHSSKASIDDTTQNISAYSMGMLQNTNHYIRHEVSKGRPCLFLQDCAKLHSVYIMYILKEFGCFIKTDIT